MNLYIETSALLRWLFGGPRGEAVRALLSGATRIFSSRLTLVEAHGALIGAVLLGEITERISLEIEKDLAGAAARWTLVEILPEIVERAGRRFPSEPIRSLEAIHLATVVFLVPEAESLSIVSTDDRIGRNAPLLGLELALHD